MLPNTAVLRFYVLHLFLFFQLASFVLNRQSHEHEPFASNCLERLRSIKRIRKRVTDYLNANGATTGKNYGTGGEAAPGSQDNFDKLFVIEDFTDYVWLKLHWLTGTSVILCVAESSHCATSWQLTVYICVCVCVCKASCAPTLCGRWAL